MGEFRKFQGFSWIIDDESYFTLKHSTINRNNNFYSSDVSLTSASVKYSPTAKFDKKILVWICFSANGVSTPYFVPSGLAINKNTYLNECIVKRLIPFIKRFHSDGQYVFWPDLASSHYAKTVIEYFRDKKVNFVEKEDNPPNVAECRPIEDFWVILKAKVYEHNWLAETLDQLRNRINYCLKNVDLKAVQGLIGSISSRLDKIRRNGVIESQ